MSKEKPTMLTVKQAAEKIGVSVPRVHQLIKDGRLSAEKFGRDYMISSDAITAELLERPTGRPKKTDSPQIAELARLKSELDSMEDSYLRDVATAQYESKLNEVKQLLSNDEDIDKLIKTAIKKQSK